jgi:hypothetical protein
MAVIIGSRIELKRIALISSKACVHTYPYSTFVISRLFSRDAWLRNFLWWETAPTKSFGHVAGKRGSLAGGVLPLRASSTPPPAIKLRLSEKATQELQ